MESRAHAAVGTVVSAALVVALGVSWVPGVDAVGTLPAAVALWGYGLALSVFVDLDHFLVARLQAGDWRHLRRVLGAPTDAVWGQAWIFEDTELGYERLLSHALLGGALVAATWLVAPPLGGFTAVVLYAHVLADLLREAEVA